MKVNHIFYNQTFQKQFQNLPHLIQKNAIQKEAIFRQNPFSPGLRLHSLQGSLKGLWSISIDRRYRIIFKVMSDGNILFFSIGKHAIYKT